MRIGVVEYLESYLTAGEVQLRRCRKCNGVRAIVRTLPYGPFPLPEQWEGVLVVRPRASRTGAHYADVLYPQLGVPEGRPRAQARVFLGRFQLLPEELDEFGSGSILARTRLDRPFAHDVIVRGWVDELPEPREEHLCPSCWEGEVQRLAKVRQGNLYIAPAWRWWEEREDAVPSRLFSSYQPGVREAKGRVEVFNHCLVPADEASELEAFIRGNYGHVEVRGAAVVRSPDHEEVVVPEGRWVFWHPWPRDGMD